MSCKIKKHNKNNIDKNKLKDLDVIDERLNVEFVKLLNEFKENTKCCNTKCKFHDLELPSYELDFHHVIPRSVTNNDQKITDETSETSQEVLKQGMISRMVNNGGSYKVIYELDRTVLLCCMCHRDVHYKLTHHMLSADPYIDKKYDLTNKFLEFLDSKDTDKTKALYNTYLNGVNAYRKKYGLTSRIVKDDIKDIDNSEIDKISQDTENSDNIDTSIN